MKKLLTIIFLLISVSSLFANETNKNEDYTVDVSANDDHFSTDTDEDGNTIYTAYLGPLNSKGWNGEKPIFPRLAMRKVAKEKCQEQGYLKATNLKFNKIKICEGRTNRSGCKFGTREVVGYKAAFNCKH